MINQYEPSETLLYDAFLYINDNVLSKLPESAWVAGGMLKSAIGINDPTADIDLYSFDYRKNLEFLLSRDWVNIFENNNTCSVEKDGNCIDVVKKSFKTPIETISDFDFVHCCAAVDHKYVYMHSNFYATVKDKRIEIINKNRENLPFRINKYLARGYKIDLKQLEEITLVKNDEYNPRLSSNRSAKNKNMIDWAKILGLSFKRQITPDIYMDF